MKSISLLLLRASTGIYMVLWGAMKLFFSERAVGVSQKYYAGLLDANVINYGLGALQVTVGLFVLFGLMRGVMNFIQAAWYLVGLLSITLYILDPFAFYFVDSAKLTFFPSTTLFFASLIMIAFKEYDTLSLDEKFKS